MASAGSISSICPLSVSVSPDGLPLIQISTDELFLRLTLPSVSTSTDGMFSSISAADAPSPTILWSTLNTLLSMSSFMLEPCPMTSTSAICFASSVSFTVPIRMCLSTGVDATSLLYVVYPKNVALNVYFPSSACSSNIPSASEKPPVTGSEEPCLYRATFTKSNG